MYPMRLSARSCQRTAVLTYHVCAHGQPQPQHASTEHAPGRICPMPASSQQQEKWNTATSGPLEKSRRAFPGSANTDTTSADIRAGCALGKAHINTHTSSPRADTPLPKEKPCTRVRQSTRLSKLEIEWLGGRSAPGSCCSELYTYDTYYTHSAAVLLCPTVSVVVILGVRQYRPGEERLSIDRQGIGSLIATTLQLCRTSY